jgi:shikimate kinase
VNLYRNNLKNREFGKEAPQNCDSDLVTIAEGQGTSENHNSEAKPTQPKPDSSGCFGIILCGLPKSGKTAIGKQLAASLQCAFIDTDRLIESAYAFEQKISLSCREIYLKEGKSFFRTLEKKQVALLSTTVSRVIAIGGGTLEDPGSLDHLKQLGLFIYLKTPLETLWERIKSNELPSYLNPNDPQLSFYELAARRIPLYEKAASMMIDTDRMSEEQIVHNIIGSIWPATLLGTSLKLQRGENPTVKPSALSSMDALPGLR